VSRREGGLYLIHSQPGYPVFTKAGAGAKVGARSRGGVRVGARSRGGVRVGARSRGGVRVGARSRGGVREETLLQNIAGDIENPDHLWGQTFMCVNLDASNIGIVRNHIATINANVYDKKGGVGQEGTSGRRDLKSRGGVIFDLFSKRRDLYQDIWSGMVSAHYNRPLYVSTWTKGSSKKLKSICDDNRNNQVALDDVLEHKYSVPVTSGPFNFHSPSTSFVNSPIADFSAGQDHSKWAVGKNADDDLFCIGDLNRQESQTGRGGGAMCFHNIQVARAIRNMVADTKCEKDRRELEQQEQHQQQ